MIYSRERLLIFWDGAGWHRGSKVQEFIKEDKNIEIIYFPKYAPELNPQEYVWKNGRSKVTHNEFIKDIDQSTDKFVDYLNNTNFNYPLLGFRLNPILKWEEYKAIFFSLHQEWRVQKKRENLKNLQRKGKIEMRKIPI